MDSSEAAEGTTTFNLGPFVVSVANDVGPRIVGYARVSGPQLFANLAGETIEHPAVGSFSFVGGHRLWRAPEVPAVTYQPDEGPINIEAVDDAIRVTGEPDGDGLVKTITLRRRGDLTVVDHTIRNEGWRPARCALWAITQLTPGGTAVLPQSGAPVDADGVLPNRSVVVWPYTDLSAPEIEYRADAIEIAASRREAKLKLGQENRRGWIAYALGNDVFVKWSPLHREGIEYPDRGSSVECYRDHRFLELESLGPLSNLAPGKEVSHREVWTLTGLGDKSLREVLAALPIDPLEESA